MPIKAEPWKNMPWIWSTRLFQIPTLFNILCMKKVDSIDSNYFFITKEFDGHQYELFYLDKWFPTGVPRHTRVPPNI